jgi:type I restriction enzyme S subunit
MNMQSIPLRSLAAVRSGGGAPQDSTKFTATGHPFIRAGSLSKLLDGAREDELEKLEPTVAAEHGLTLFPSGTVLFAKSGMSATKGHIYRLRQPAYVVNHLAALVPHDPDDSTFIVRALQRFPPTALVRDSAYPSIRLGDIEDMKVFAPLDSADRRWIAQVLDRSEALRAKRRDALVQLDTLTQAIFLDLFGDPATNPKGWPKVSIESVAGIIVPTRDKPKYFRGTIPWVTLPDLDGLFISRAKNLLTVEDAEEVGNRLIPSNSVLLSCAGTLGKIAITTTQVYANQQFYGLVPQGDKLDTTFFALCLLLRGETFFANLGGSFTIGFFSKQKALDIHIPLPPFSLQREFAGRVTALEKLKSAYRASLAELDALFGVIQHRAFRGDL